MANHKVGLTVRKKSIHYQISKYIDDELVIEQQIINVLPDSWTIIRQIFVDQGWLLTFTVLY